MQQKERVKGERAHIWALALIVSETLNIDMNSRRIAMVQKHDALFCLEAFILEF